MVGIIAPWHYSVEPLNILRNLGVQLVHEVGLHEHVDVGDVQGDKALALESFWKLPPETVQMRFLHKKDDVCPANVAFGHDDASIWLRAGGADLKARDAAEN